MLNILIIGAGEVGGHAAEVLSEAGHRVTVIDLDGERLQQLGNKSDLRTLQGHGAHFDVLYEAGAPKCDLMIAATKNDETNLLAASMAKAAGAKRTIVRAHHTANFSLRGTRYASQLGIDELICPEHLASAYAARTIRNPGSLVLEEFARGELIMQRVQVGESASAIGQRLADLSLPGKTRLATVEHGGTPAIAHSQTVIAAGDHVTLIGEKSSLTSALRLFGKDKEKRIQIAIMGETSTAVWLCRALRNRAFSVRLFVQGHGRAEELSEKLSHVTVLEADPTDALTVTDEHMEQVEAFVAATDDDENNILAGAQAKTLGVRMAFVILQRAKYQHLLHHVGIDHSVSPREVAVKAILQMIAEGTVRSLATFAEGAAEVYEVPVSRRGKFIGKELRHVKLPSQAMIAAIRRGSEVLLPGADDQIMLDDTLLMIGPAEIGPELKALFVSS